MHDLFLSHNSADKPAVEALAHRLRASGIEPWLDKWNLIAGNPWQQEIEQAIDTCRVCAVFIGPSGMGPWQDEEMRAAIDRRVSKGNFRIIPVLLPGAARSKRGSLPTFLSATTWVEFRDTLDDEDAFHRLLSGVYGVEPGAVSGGDGFTSNVCPYRGLQVFDVEHAPLFFGRRALTEWLLEAIRPEEGKANRFLAMLGASGSGKSSLARAGLLASLKKGELADSQHWPQIILRPGAKPLESLVVASCHSGVTDKNQGELIELFEQNDSQLHWQCRQALHGQPDDRRIVVLVDQFEEIFTLCRDDAERVAFINNLLTAATDVSGQVIVLLTLRADFYGKCAVYPHLAAALSDDQLLISPMTEEELRGAIEMPALRAGCELEAGLVDVLLKDVKDQPGSLPLLEYTLTRLWEQRQSRVLRLADYWDLGGLEGALNQRADEVYAGLSVEQQAICRSVFLRLVKPGEGTEDTRRRANLSEFGEGEETTAVVQKLANVRLITTQKAVGNGQAFAEVTHEALIRNWGQLREWIEADLESLKQRVQISQAAAEWEEHDEDDAWLLTGTRLELVEEWGQGDATNLSELESRFLAQSQDAYERRLVMEKDRLERQRKSLVRTRWLSGLMAVFALLMVLSGGFAWMSADEAEVAKQEAQSKEREATSHLLEANYNLAKAFEEKANNILTDEVINGDARLDISQWRTVFLYGLQAAKQKVAKGKLAVLPYTLGSLATAREQDLSIEKKKTAALNIGGLSSVAINPNGKLIATALGDDVIQLWNLKTGSLVQTLLEDMFKGEYFGAMVSSPEVQFSSDGSLLAAVSRKGVIRIWDVESRAILETTLGDGDPLYFIEFSSDNRLIASVGYDGNVKIWDVKSGNILQTLHINKSDVEALIFSSSDEVLITVKSNGMVQRWDVDSGAILQNSTHLNHNSLVRLAVFSPDGKIIATEGDDNVVRLWDLQNGTILQILQGYTKKVSSMEFSPDSKVIITGADDYSVKIWDVRKGTLLKTLHGVNSVQSLSVSLDGQMVVAGVADHTVHLWDVKTGKRLHTPQGHSLDVTTLAYSPDGKMIASGSFDNKVNLWDSYSGNIQKRLLGHSDLICSVAFSPDGNVIASGSHDNTIRIWDRLTGKVLKILQDGESNGFCSIAFSPNGKVITSGSHDSTIRMWDTQTGKSLKVLQGHDRGVCSVVYSPNGKLLASSSYGGKVVLWNLEKGTSKIVYALSNNGKGMCSLAFNHNGKLLVVGSFDNTAYLWEVETGRTLDILRGHSDGIRTVAFSPDGKVIATGASDKTIRLWSVFSGKSLRVIQGHTADVESIAFSPDGQTLASASYDHSLRLWDVQAFGDLKLQPVNADLRSAVFSPDGREVAAKSRNSIWRWNALTGESLNSLKVHGHSVSEFNYSPDGKMIVSDSRVNSFLSKNAMHLWDAQTGRNLEVFQYDRGASSINALAFSPNGKKIVTSDKYHVYLWDTQKGVNITLRDSSTVGTIFSLDYSPDGEVIAGGGESGAIRLWDAQSGNDLKVFQSKNSSPIYSIVYSPDGKTIAAASEDGVVRLWDVVNGEVLKTLQNESANSAYSVAFSPDGKTIAAASKDGTIRLWDVVSGKILKTLQINNSGATYSIAYSSDGETIVSTSENGMVRLWRLNDPIHRLVYDFSPTEVAGALQFIWELDVDGLQVKPWKPYSSSLFPQMGYYIAFTDKTRKFRPLLDSPRLNETKLSQIVRFLEERCAYRHPERYNCSPVTD